MAERLTQLSEHLYRFRDTCNVYLLVDGEAGLLIDAGSGEVLEHLSELGVKQVEWLLHTHHHRDQCWGTPRLREHGAKVAVPEYERHLFDQAELFWQQRRTFDNYNDRNTFFAIGRIYSCRHDSGRLRDFHLALLRVSCATREGTHPWFQRLTGNGRRQAGGVHRRPAGGGRENCINCTPWSTPTGRWKELFSPCNRRGR